MSNDGKDDKYWKEKLTPEEYAVTRQKGTERAFTGEYYHTKDPGIYTCKCCGESLFSSDTKYDSGSGWPSFFEAIKDKVDTESDNSHFMQRIEIKCKKCGAHLGHVFDDGPNPTGKRYCVNSLSLKLKKKLP